MTMTFRAGLHLEMPSLNLLYDGVANSVDAAGAVDGDVNGDGFGDLFTFRNLAGFENVFTIPDPSPYVILGRTEWPDAMLGFVADGATTDTSLLPQDIRDDQMRFMAISERTSATGDIDGDGFDDAAVTTKGLDQSIDGADPWSPPGDSYIVFGGPGGVPDLDAGEIDGINGFAFVDSFAVEAYRAGEPLFWAGRHLAILPDINGDGFDDIAISTGFLDEGGFGNDTAYDFAFVVFGGRENLTRLDALDGAADGQIERKWLLSLFLDDTGERAVERTPGTTVFGGEGDDTIYALGGGNSVDGAGGADRLVGSDLGESLTGGDGDDVVIARDGDDVLRGNAGDDRLVAGAGDDAIFGDAGGDVILAEGGSDGVLGGDGNDHFDGGDGDDRLCGQNGDDTIDGGAGTDTLDGGAGVDRIAGGSGRDRFVFREGFGEDRLLDYNTYLEKLDFSGHADVDAFADLTIRQIGPHTLITDPTDGRLLLANVDAETISAGDFLI